MDYKTCLLSLILLFGGIHELKAKEVSAEDRKLLVISSYSPLKERGSRIISAFMDELGQSTNTKVNIEYLDCEANPDFEAWGSWMNSLFHAYNALPEAVILIGSEAWMAYRHSCVKKWRDIPVILGGVKKGIIDYAGAKTKDIHDILSTKTTFDGYKVTGYYIVDYFEENLRLIKQLQPEVKHIIFYYDDRYHQIFFEPYLKSMIEKIGDLKLHYLPGSRLSTTALLDSIALTDNHYALISAGWYTDVNESLHASTMLSNELPYHTDKFVYGILDLDFGDSHNFGGYFVTGEEMGKDLARLTYAVLKNGIEKAPAFTITPTRPRYHLNYTTFSQSGISKSRLPGNVVWHNMLPSFWEEYPEEVITFFFLLVCLVIVILFIVYNRKRKEKEYVRLVSKMTHLLENMPDMVVIYDSFLNVVDIVNPQQNVLLVLTKEEVLGKNIREIGKMAPEFEKAFEIIEQNVRRTIKDKKQYSFNYKVKLDDKESFAEARTALFEGDNVICFVRDITPRVAAQKEVLKLKTFLQSIIDNLPVGLFVKDVSDDFRYIFYNQKTIEFYQNKSGIFLGKNDFELNDPKAAIYREEDMMVLNSDTPLTYERSIYDKEGGLLHWGVLTKTKLLNNDDSCYLVGIVVDITDIRKNEIELGNVKNELSLALDAGSLSVWTYDVPQKEFVSFYHDTVAQNGLSFEEAYSILHPDDREKYKRFMEMLISGEKEKDSVRLRFKRGENYRWYETHAIGIRSVNNGLISQIVGTERDITDEIGKQQELVESKFKLELSFEAADIVPWDYNVEEGLFYSGSEKSVFFGKKFSLSDYLVLVHPDYRDKFNRELYRVIYREIDVMDLVIYTTALSGNYEWTQLTAKAMGVDKEGNALKIMGTRKYITEAVEAERRLKDYIFKSDLVIKSGGIVQWDYDTTTGIFSSPNPESFMYHGITLEKYYSYMYEEDIDIVEEAFRKLMQGEVEAVTIQIRVKLQNKDYRWVEVHGVAYERDEKGKLMKITGLRRDITDWKNVTNELILLRDKAEESNRLKTAFLANMSHEIRTPLNAIVGFSDLIAQTTDSGEIQDYCRIIETNNELLLQLINDILDLSKIEAGQLEFVYSDINVSAIFRDLEQIYLYRIKPEVQLISELPDETYIIHSEKNRLTQVISNFLSNASKFTSSGSIRMGYERVEKGLRFYVTDTGKGIASENLKNVFERFTKFDSFVQGTGLGLSICEMIVNRLGGKIGVDSELGKGSTFWFFIPCEVYSVEKEERPDLLLQKTGVSVKMENSDKKTILIAEDNDSNFLFLSTVLKKEYELVWAKNGKEAIALYEEKAPQVILMDIKMPEMDGLEATWEIRKIDKRIPIIALTAYAFDEDRIRAAEAGCDEFLTKPVNVKMLKDLLVRLFEA
ncbi:response regulator [uncultured Sanguibacteroides sp.]|uniref:response regulator n=1 Tax=uncultured Sanguibacteroides sp. TaxID=1635151 RepID=UPI0025D572B8|nr:response regulator [uncultured Sanguibacteroides sp.]